MLRGGEAAAEEEEEARRRFMTRAALKLEPGELVLDHGWWQRLGCLNA